MLHFLFGWCVLTGLQGKTVWPNYEVFFRALVSDCSNPILCCSLLCILHSPYRFPNPHYIHQTGSSAHLGVPCLCPIISDFHTWSFSHLGFARLCLSISFTHTEFLSLLVAFLLQSHLLTSYPPPFSFLRVFQGGPNCFSSPLGATTPSSSAPLFCTLSPLHTPQIRDVTPPTAPGLPAVALYKSYLTGFLLPLICILPQASRLSHLLITLLSSP